MSSRATAAELVEFDMDMLKGAQHLFRYARYFAKNTAFF